MMMTQACHFPKSAVALNNRNIVSKRIVRTPQRNRSYCFAVVLKCVLLVIQICCITSFTVIRNTAPTKTQHYQINYPFPFSPSSIGATAYTDRVIRRNGGSITLFMNPPNYDNDTTVKRNKNEEENEEESISDVDARVLQSLLQDKKLDFTTEQGVRELLERGTVKKSPTAVNDDKKQNAYEDDDSVFSSTIIKTLTDTKLWRSLQAKSSKVLESVGIWVANKVEQDVKVLAALGLFAWDRAVQDVARALPEAQQQIRRTTRFILTNSSSFNEEEYQKQEEEYLKRRNREFERFKPAEEIKSVSKEVFNILTGKRTTLSRTFGGNSRIGSTAAGRALRTIAPAGSANAAERQRRAYEQSQKLKQQNKDVTRIASTVVDTAWELRRELKSERNTPGYRTEPIRNAISAAAASTGNLLREAAIEARLAAAKRKELRALQQAQEQSQQPSNTATVAEPTQSTQSTTSNIYTTYIPSKTQQEVVQELLDRMQEEVDELSDRINRCIQSPGETWLLNAPADANTGTNVLREVVTKMILIRNEVDAQAVNPFTTSNAISRTDKLQFIRRAVDDLYKLTSNKVSTEVGTKLYSYLLYGSTINPTGIESSKSFLQNLDPFTNQLSTAISLLDVATKDKEGSTPTTHNYYAAAVVEEIPVVPNGASSGGGAFFAQTRNIVIDDDPIGQQAIVSPVVDVVQEVVTTSFDDVSIDDRTSTIPIEEEIIIPKFVDVQVDTVITQPISNQNQIIDDVEVYSSSSTYQQSTVEVISDNDSVNGFVTEIVSDDDFENAFATSKQTQTISDEELAKEEEEIANKSKSNIVAVATLRSLDILFFLLEKMLTVGVPTTVTVVSTVVARLEAVQNEGRGNKGWKKFDKLNNNARGRY